MPCTSIFEYLPFVQAGCGVGFVLLTDHTVNRRNCSRNHTYTVLSKTTDWKSTSYFIIGES